jgi:mono/diheme cytochrome c family protein
MAVTAFILFWILVGVGLVFVAMSGGPRGARQRLHSQSRRGQRIAYGLFAAALILLGIAVPGLVIAAVSDRDSVPEAGIDSLTAQEQRGRELFGQRCRNCHALQAASATARVGPDLDQLRPNADLVIAAIEEGRARGNGQMAADLVVGEDVEAVAAFVARAAGQVESEEDLTDSGEPTDLGE